MKTDLGLPSVVKKPLVSGVTKNSLTLYWYNESIHHFGSAAKKFRIETTGDGEVDRDFIWNYLML